MELNFETKLELNFVIIGENLLFNYNKNVWNVTRNLFLGVFNLELAILRVFLQIKLLHVCQNRFIKNI